ncbi:MAG TPA: protein YgfX [Burkholderiales bacterium]|nr:protein YgfX [Burkholderiales bacterium]
MSGALRLELKASRTFAAAILVAHAAAAVAAYVAITGLMAALLAGMLFLLGLASAWRRALLAASGSVRVIEIGGAEPAIELAGGERFRAVVAPRRYVTRYLVALPLTTPFRTTLLVTADMLSREQFRRLRLWALWDKLPAVAAKQLAA